MSGARGVKASDVLASIEGLEATRNNQLMVMPTLQTTRDRRIMAVGGTRISSERGAGIA
jgi:NADH dehydrogenase